MVRPSCLSVLSASRAHSPPHSLPAAHPHRTVHGPDPRDVPALDPAHRPLPVPDVRHRALPGPLWSTVTVDAASRLAPRHSTALRLLMRALVGSMQFPALVLAPPTAPLDPDASPEKEPLPRGSLEVESGTALLPYRAALHRHPHHPQALKLWGLSLGMTLDLLAYMAPAPGAPLTPWDADALMGVSGLPLGADEDIDYDVWNASGNGTGADAGGMRRRKSGRGGRRGRGRINAPPSLTAVFPRFSYPDVNFWIWCVPSLLARARWLDGRLTHLFSFCVC